MYSSTAGLSSCQKKKSLKQQGLGNKIMRADPFTDKELEVLRKKSLLGKDEHFCNEIGLRV